MNDLISRQAAVDAFEGEIYSLSLFEKIQKLPSAQSTLYGYNIEHLAYIAKVMEKQNLTPELVTNLLKDNGYAVELVIDSLLDALHKVGISHKKKIAHKINLHQYPAAWICSECGSKHFDFGDKYCSCCGVDVRESKDE